MNGQYEVLRPFITERINALVRGRLFEGLKFFGTSALRPGFDRGEVKLALLLVRIAHEKEVFTKEEAALLASPMRQPRQREDEGSYADESENGDTGNKAEIKATKPKRRKPEVG